jgi:UPF0755 protein
MKIRASGSPEFIFILFTSVFLTVLVLYISLFTPISHEDSWKEIKVPEGSTYTEGINILKREGTIKNEFVFLLLGRLTKLDRNLKAGYYNLNSSMSTWEVFDRLRKGMIVEFRITIPEGSRLEDILAKLKKKSLINVSTEQIVNDPEFLDSLDIDSPSLEGYLFPDTYNFAKGVDPHDIFRIMVNRLREQLDETVLERADELGMSEREVLTLASIIEHEALFDRERPVISAVYHNRLKRNMRLQADPTVVYGIKKMQEGISRSDLKRKTPYNTYVIRGLPPGPINSPGIQSIRAALFPADVDYMFFVSKNNGTHYFSSTGEEHLKAVMLYQRNKRSPDAEPEAGTDSATQELGTADETGTMNDGKEDETENKTDTTRES